MVVEFPAWTFTEVWSQVVALLTNELVSSLVMAMLALSIAAMVIQFVKSVVGGNSDMGG